MTDLTDSPIGATRDRVQLEHSKQMILCHPDGVCDGEVCPIHNRTDHHMRSWPQLWRDDRQLIERTCPHGVGHPDPDHLTSFARRHTDHPARVSAESMHGCDGCCLRSNA